MADEERPSESPQRAADQRQPMSPAKRKRLQQCFEHGSRQTAQENYDYATELFTQCVLGDPGNLIYLQNFLGNLQKKYNNNKKGSKLALFKGAGARAALKKASMRKDWEAVIKRGLEVLKLNPWDVSTLTTMATGARELGCDECEMFYLKSALDTTPKDPEVNKLCAIAARERGLFDQAIACWHRVEQARPGDEEAVKAIADLAVEKTISQGGYEDAESSKEVMAGKPGMGPKRVLTPEEKLQREITNDPDNPANYLDLAQIYTREEQFDKAEEVLAQAFEVSGGDLDIRERWEDAQLRGLRQEVIASKKAVEEKRTPETKRKYEKLRNQFNLKELEVYKNRCERYPNNLAFKFELGIRYKIAGQYNEAIKQFQLARNDPRRKGVCLLELGRCFQQIKQDRLAMRHYESAIDEIPDRDGVNKKKTLYLAGKMAMSLSDLDTSEKHLTTLAGLDFGYRDVSALLDKIMELRKNM